MSESSLPLSQTGEQASLIPQMPAPDVTANTGVQASVVSSGNPSQADLAMLKQEMEALRQQTLVQQKRNQDLARFLSDDTSTNKQEAEALARVNQLLQNPDGFIGTTVQQAVAQAVAQQRNVEQLAQEMRQKHADLTGFEPAILQAASHIFNQASQTGQYMDERTALETAATQFRQKLQQYSSLAEQRQQQEQMRQNAIPFSVGTTGQVPSDGKINWETLSDADFSKARSMYLKGKGISV